MKLAKLLEMCSLEGVQLNVIDENLEVSFNDNPSDHLLGLLKENKQALIAFIGEQNQASNQSAAVEVAPRDAARERWPLSFAQQRLWFIEQMEQGSALYNMVGMVEYSGELQPRTAERAIQTIIQRHEVLRTGFLDTKAGLQQIISDAPGFSLQVLDLIGHDQADQESAIDRLRQDTGQTQFALESDLLLRAVVARLTENSGLILFCVHHIAADGWSMALLVREFTTAYAAYADGQQPNLPELTVQYADYSLWQRGYFSGQTLVDQLSFWREKLAGIPQVHNLPLDYPRPALQEFTGATHVVALDAVLAARLVELAQTSNVTLFTLLQAAFSVFLARWSNQRDVVFAVPVAGRPDPALETLIGLFVNTAVQRVRLEQNVPFTELLTSVSKVNSDTSFYHDLPFDLLVEALNPERSLSYHPVFQILFNYQKAQSADISVPGLSFRQVPQAAEIVNYDLELSIIEKDGAFSLHWNFATHLFAGDSIARMARSFEALLLSICHQPQQPVFNLNIIPGQQHEQPSIVSEVRDPSRLTIPFHDLFAVSAEQHGAKAAVLCEDRLTTYAELDMQANQLANYLRERGAKPGALVGVCIDRSAQLIVSLLAVLKSGAAYVPLDPNYPISRLEHIVEDAGISILLTRTDTQPSLGAAVQRLELDDSVIQKELSEVNPVLEFSASSELDHLAYAIYTSGSTGQPKGVEINHRALVNFLLAMQKNPGCEPEDMLLAVTSISFDIAALELFLPLLCGATLVLASADQCVDGKALGKLLNQQPISLLQATPATWWMLLEAGEWNASQSLKALCGGEALSTELAGRLLGKVTALFNMYGPTETTIWSSCKQVDQQDLLPAGIPVSIGQPIDNTSFYILDSYGQPVPTGVAGELHIGGSGLAVGYRNRPQLTVEKFVESGQYADISERLYKTGDLVRLNLDGRIEFIGRADHQLKIRGFRVEAAEVERALLQQDVIREAVVVARGSDNTKRLVAYVIPTREPGSDEQREELTHQVQAGLTESLPHYMVPSALLLLEEFPLTPNGKVDRSRLPEPEIMAGSEQVEPRGYYEQQLARIWCELLGLPQISVTTDFFAIGGHSLLATRLVNLINEKFSTDITIKAIFQHSTIEKLARYLVSTNQDVEVDIGRADRETALSLSPAQQRLWFIDYQQGGAAEYNIPVALKLTGEVDQAALRAALSSMVQRHEILRTNYEQDQGVPLQVVHPADSVDSVFEKVSVGADDLNQAVVERVKRPFDLVQDSMLRCTLFSLSATEHVLLLVVHHIAADGWSLQVMVKELLASYQSHQGATAADLPLLEVQYADYAAWQQRALQEGRLQAQLAYWRDQLSTAPQVHSIPVDVARDQLQNAEPNALTAALGESLTQQLKQYAEANHVTLFMLLHCALAGLVSRWSHVDDVVIGTPVAGRQHADLEPLIGLFVNSLALRSKIPQGKPFSAVLTDSKQQLIEAYQNQEVPFDLVVDELGVARNHHHAPLFQILFSLQQAEHDDLSLPGVDIELLEIDHALTKFELELAVVETDDRLVMNWNYLQPLFSAATVQRIADSFEKLLTDIVAGIDLPIAQYQLTSEADKHWLLSQNSYSNEIQPDIRCLHELFSEQARTQGEKIAIRCGGQSLTYAELERQSSLLAHHLVESGAQPNSLVAICMQRSLQMVVGILAILKAGAGYVPLDPLYPDQRLLHMLEDSEVKLLLTEIALQDRVADLAVPTVFADAEETLVAISAYDLDKLHKPLIKPDHLAYMIYTSGSTGNPKGVLVEHRNVTRLFKAAEEHFTFAAQDVWSLFHSYAFDFSVWELWGALLYGGQVEIVPYEVSRSPADFAELLRAQGVTVLSQTPSAFYALLKESVQDCSLPALRYVVFGGEALNPVRLRDWFSGDTEDAAELVNMYGITETTVHVTYKRITRQDLDQPGSNIGRPLADLAVYICDEALNQLPIGMVGEVYVGGGGVTRGYHKRPQLTQERFVSQKFSGVEQRVYRTGDLARYLESGELEYIGRADDQVKLSGFRIELGEIESALLKHESVKDAVVAMKGVAEAQYLAAYVVTHDRDIQPGVLVDELKRDLRQALPEYMVPTSLAVLEHIPLTVNGKADRAALPEMETSQEAYQAPQTPTEIKLAGIWAGLINRPSEQISAKANFFDLGGNSLLSVRLLTEMHNAFGVELSVRDVFEALDLTMLAGKLDEQMAAIVDDPSLEDVDEMSEEEVDRLLAELNQVDS